MSTTPLSVDIDFRFLEARPGITMVLLADTPFYTIVAVSNDFVTTSGMKRDEVIGKSHFTVFPENPAEPMSSGVHSLRDSFEYILQYKTPHSLPLVRYDIPDGKGGFLEKYWKSSNAPVFNEQGAVAYVIHTSEDVTDRVLAERTEEKHQELQRAYQQMEESEKKYRTLFESIDQGFCVVELIYDENGRPVDHLFLESNPLFEAQTGLKDVKGKTAREVAPTIETRWFELYDQVLRTGKPIRFAEESKALNRWFDVYAFRVNSNGVHRVAVLFTDITDQKKADVVVSRSEQRFRGMVEKAPVAISVNRGENLVFDVVNEKMLQLLGKDKDVIGKPFLEVMPEMEDQPIMDVLYQILRTGEPVYGNEQLVPIKKGDTWEERYFNFVYTPLIEGGKVVGIMDVATEVTEQVKARKKIEESQQRFYTLANSINQLAWIADDAGWIYWYNDRWFDYTGTTLEEMEGWGWEKVHHPDHIDRVVSFVKEAWPKGEPWELIFPLRRHDGEYRWFLTRGVPVRDNDGKVVQWIGTNTDIDDQKQAEVLLEQRVQERTIELEMRTQELEQFTYVSHHDLQEPLRKIVMFSDMVRSDSYDRLSEASRKRLDKVSTAANRMSIALRDVLNFASLSKEEQFVLVDLEEVLASVQMDLELTIQEKEAKLHTAIMPTIKAIPSQMHQLFYNLVNNALKFSKPSQQPIITISCEKVNEKRLLSEHGLEQHRTYYEFAVQDNGIGFDSEAAEKIFVMFQRLHTKDAYAGTGIGLALCRKVVQNHGGKIWAESLPGEGATFKVLLPAE